MIQFLISLFFLHHTLFADLVDHLKPCPGKSAQNSFGQIDFIYMINLDQRPEKFAYSSEALQRYGIYPYRFSAVNGWELSLEAINDVGLRYAPGMIELFATTFPVEAKGQASHEFLGKSERAYFSHGMTRGAIGICLSHISILKDAWDAGYETIWVMEDDIEVIQDPQILPELIRKLDDLVGRGNWDVLFTDPNTKGSDGQYVTVSSIAKRPDLKWATAEKSRECAERISPDFKKIFARFGAYSMIIRRSGIKKLLEFSLEHKVYLPYDIEYYLPPGLNRFSLNYDVVSTQPRAPSDNAAPLYGQ